MDHADPDLTLSMQLEDLSFTCTGPKSEVLKLFAEWKKLAGFAVDSKTGVVVDMRPLNEKGN